MAPHHPDTSPAPVAPSPTAEGGEVLRGNLLSDGIVKPIQADRDAAAELTKRWISRVDAKRIAAGNGDGHWIVQAFARHRIANTRPSPVSAHEQRMREALETVLAYREGRAPYDFYKLPHADDRALAALDAWQEVESQIRAALATSKDREG